MVALRRVDEGAFANLVLPELFESIERAEGPLDHREKAFATELVYGTVRMRRACAWLVERHLQRDADEDTERALHLGAYQLVFLGTPAHAAVAATVNATPPRSQGFVNAVLRSLARELDKRLRDHRDLPWPNDATRLSYPDWIVSTLRRDLGEERASAALAAMNEAAVVHRRADGYVQDPASQMVADAVAALPGDRVLDLCAAPGGKATALAQLGAHVTAIDLHAHRCRLIEENAAALAVADRIVVHELDATSLPESLWRDGFDRVLVDAPCSGLGSLRRRPDARWRIDANDVADLVQLQHALLRSAAKAVAVGGVVVYSVCTLTDAETIGIDRWLETEFPDLVALEPLESDGWEGLGRGARILPGDTDGMAVFRYRRVAPGTGEPGSGAVLAQTP